MRTIDDIRNLLLAGADKVSINTEAVKRPEFVREAAEKFGSQCIVVAIDAKRELENWRTGELEKKSNRQFLNSPIPQFQIYTHGGRNAPGIDAVEWAKKMVELGAGEILLTSMDRDGTKAGVDVELTLAVSEAVSVPVIANGGAGTRQDFVDARERGGADALAASSIFHFSDSNITQVKSFLLNAGVPVRPI